MEIAKVSSGGRICVFDRGSAQGSWMNGSPLGGLMANENATYLDEGEVDLVIGSQDSVFRYRLTISSKNLIEFTMGFPPSFPGLLEKSIEFKFGTEREGFEPSTEVASCNSLAGSRFQPLSHLSSGMHRIPSAVPLVRLQRGADVV